MSSPELLFTRIAPISSALPAPHPLLVLLHGRGSDENDLLGLLPALDPRFLVASARAPRSFEYGGYTWCDLHEPGRLQEEQFAESQGQLAETIGSLCGTQPVDPERVFLLGFSMGAMMALAFALSRPERARGVVAHSGYLPEGERLTYRWNELAPTGIFMAHGTVDPVVPVQLARQSRQRLEAAGAHLTYREYPIPHTISDESLRDLSAWLSDSLGRS